MADESSSNIIQGDSVRRKKPRDIISLQQEQSMSIGMGIDLCMDDRDNSRSRSSQPWPTEAAQAAPVLHRHGHRPFSLSPFAVAQASTSSSSRCSPSHSSSSSPASPSALPAPPAPAPVVVSDSAHCIPALTSNHSHNRPHPPSLSLLTANLDVLLSPLPPLFASPILAHPDNDDDNDDNNHDVMLASPPPGKRPRILQHALALSSPAATTPTSASSTTSSADAMLEQDKDALRKMPAKKQKGFASADAAVSSALPSPPAAPLPLASPSLPTTNTSSTSASSSYHSLYSAPDTAENVSLLSASLALSGAGGSGLAADDPPAAPQQQQQQQQQDGYARYMPTLQPTLGSPAMVDVSSNVQTHTPVTPSPGGYHYANSNNSSSSDNGAVLLANAAAAAAAAAVASLSTSAPPPPPPTSSLPQSLPSQWQAQHRQPQLHHNNAQLPLAMQQQQPDLYTSYAADNHTLLTPTIASFNIHPINGPNNTSNNAPPLSFHPSHYADTSAMTAADSLYSAAAQATLRQHQQQQQHLANGYQRQRHHSHQTYSSDFFPSQHHAGLYSSDASSNSSSSMLALQHSSQQQHEPPAPASPSGGAWIPSSSVTIGGHPQQQQLQQQQQHTQPRPRHMSSSALLNPGLTGHYLSSPQHPPTTADSGGAADLSYAAQGHPQQHPDYAAMGSSVESSFFSELSAPPSRTMSSFAGQGRHQRPGPTPLQVSNFPSDTFAKFDDRHFAPQQQQQHRQQSSNVHTTSLAGTAVPALSLPGEVSYQHHQQQHQVSAVAHESSAAAAAAPEIDADAVREQSLRFDGDMYTPRLVRFSGHAKEGYCDLCPEGRWLQLKNSAFWYHKQFYHGISSVSGQPFFDPLEKRIVLDPSGSETVHGFCHHCRQWITISSSKRRNSVLWYRHAHKCHEYQRPKHGSSSSSSASHAALASASNAHHHNLYQTGYRPSTTTTAAATAVPAQAHAKVATAPPHNKKLMMQHPDGGSNAAAYATDSSNLLLAFGNGGGGSNTHTGGGIDSSADLAHDLLPLMPPASSSASIRGQQHYSAAWQSAATNHATDEMFAVGATPTAMAYESQPQQQGGSRKRPAHSVE